MGASGGALAYALRRKGERCVETIDDVFAENGKTVRGQVDSVDIKQELVLQCGIADAGQRARAGVGEPVARGIGLVQLSEQAGVDVFDAHAGIRDAGKRDLHQIVAGLAIGRADQGIGIACRFRQFADVADGEDDVAGAIANQRVDAVDRVGGAGRGRHGYAGERAASLIILAGIIAADVDLDGIAPCNFDGPQKALHFLKRATGRAENRSHRSWRCRWRSSVAEFRAAPTSHLRRWCRH